jgi:hypothetical protein
MFRPVGCFAVAISALFVAGARSGSERGEEAMMPALPAAASLPLRFVEGGLPLPQPRNRDLAPGGDPRVWAAMLTELEASARRL